MDPSDWAEPRPLVKTGATGRTLSEKPFVRVLPIPEDLEGRQAQFAEAWLLLPGWGEHAPSADRPVDRTAQQLSQAMTRLQAEVLVFRTVLSFGALWRSTPPFVEASANGNAITHDLYQALGDARTLDAKETVARTPGRRWT